jgi:predicted transglutaminase-like cysteine proteinase
MDLGPIVAPPWGFLDFCAREPGQCPTSRAVAEARTGAGPRSDYWRMLFASIEPASYGRSRRPAPAVVTAERPVSQEFGQAAQREVLATTPQVLKTLGKVNRKVNGRIRSVSDSEAYGVSDFWALALDRPGRFGDCEDYVLEKRRELMRRGYSDKVLSIALVRTRWGQDHAVLLVNTDRGEMVLDSLSPWISPWHETGYSWTSRQSPLDPSVWIAVSARAG